MTTAYEPGTIPEFDKADRLKKAISVSDAGVAEMAEYLGVTRETLSRYLNGRNEAPLAIVRLIALRTGVPLNWILVGDESTDGPDGGSYGVGANRRQIELMQ
ncbi:Bacteriophage CI repressor helix-turn-helix domain [Mycobacteroides abscessus subsp. massiliense]|uniref:helix-turn-helix domain-containing protein n=1 Tax=Mycobacteroides abscessus TaxID=36809 RepID=UPI0009C627F8|nr:helix-turn-helix domain-containing protein [Mycobacteroides abscessus]SKH53290.1 Bacteriophage CI repressor helix-turn-helix domain [Mycobacteroides abscessus subsp. massiliense]SKH84117.1 Bacteriophage CI repressor helix-turn-helix domain [Mycobacteroides abscessus subsp. massiliense]SKK33780.1 Bacteriophage CI repressor helix-turn-helix domain [Mycobacteroides abscessus subsp. massiliense]SKK45604.1 Bacteriophage CI repressor helix-turn-helix domain [Mycobacteroides abscessus subsp. massil